ncbi:MAG: hypothetical protein EBZ48_13545 [Proteobacteria bacterium]|nr:hypothetical protein [Pseudomonadota bacterium]
MFNVTWPVSRILKVIAVLEGTRAGRGVGVGVAVGVLVGVGVGVGVGTSPKPMVTAPALGSAPVAPST